jgi:small subunit ribosomal protein S16
LTRQVTIPHNTLWRKRDKLVKIRLRRIGAKKNPSYRIVVADSRAPRDGAFIAAIGHYNPLTDPETIVIDQEKATSWLKQGAQPTDTAARLLAKAGIIEEPQARKDKMQAGAPKGKVSKKKKAKAAAAEEPKAEAAEAPKAEAAEAPKAEVTEEPKAKAAAEPKSEVAEEPEASTTEEPEAGVAEEPEASTTEQPKASKEGAETGTKAEPATSEEPAEPSTETSEEPS